METNKPVLFPSSMEKVGQLLIKALLGSTLTLQFLRLLVG